jgi:hypothetical protein
MKLKKVFGSVLNVKIGNSHFQTIFWLILFSISIFITSAILATHFEIACEKGKLLCWIADLSIYWRLLIISIIMILGVGVSYILFAFLKNGLVSSNNLTRKILIFSGIGIFVIISALSLINLFIQYPERINGVLKSLLTNPGGYFAFITGVFTLIGTIIAIQSIVEMKRTITSYPQLLDRLAELIENTDDSDEGVMIVSYFVLPGFWQDTSERRRKRLMNALKLRNRKIQAICLNDIEHMQMLLTIAELKNNTSDTSDIITSEEICRFQEKSMRVLHNYSGSKYFDANEETVKDDKKFNDYRCVPVTLSWEDMPPYYFFVSDHRAIIVTPVGLPRPVGEFKEKAKESSNLINDIIFRKSGADTNSEVLEALINELIPQNIEKKTIKQKSAQDAAQDAARGSGGNVDTLGFETTDRLIIHNLQKIFRNLKNSSNAQKFQINNGK